jgi:hypothetical protein
MIMMSHQMDPSMKFETKKQLADDEYAMTWYKMSGTGDGMMMPKGPFEMNTIEVVRFNSDSKAVEHWSFGSMEEMMKMMQPANKMPMGGDTTHMPMKDTTK